MSVIERADRDIVEGNHWLARQRLESHLLSVGYDPELLAKLGEIASAMHDAFNAGRFWLTSTAEGPRVDEAVAMFMTHCGNDSKTIATSLLHATRLSTLDSYPPVVQSRLRHLGLDVAIVASPSPTPLEKKRRKLWVTLIGIGIMTVFLFCCFSCVVGARQIISWLTE